MGIEDLVVKTVVELLEEIEERIQALMLKGVDLGPLPPDASAWERQLERVRREIKERKAPSQAR